MFDVAPTELMLVAVVALVVIGPKDLPKAMRVAGRWVAKAQGVARHFRSGLDEMVRQAELEEMEQKWAEENARIMREHPPATAAEPPIDPSWDSEMRPLPVRVDAAPDPAAALPGEVAAMAPVIPFPADPVRDEAPAAPLPPLDPLPGEAASAVAPPADGGTPGRA